MTAVISAFIVINSRCLLK